MKKVAAAKKFIENHYKAHMKNIQDRKERNWGVRLLKMKRNFWFS
jgi:hypothetical protein